MSRKGRELLAELAQDPAFAERLRQAQGDRSEHVRAYLDAAAGLLADLRETGFDVATVADLRTRGVGSKWAVPVLVEWLPKITYRPLKMDVIGALGSPWARPWAARPLVEEFRRVDPDTDPPGGIRWFIGDALERVADTSVLDDLIAIALDRRHGRDRSFVVLALGKMAKARDVAVPVLVSLLDDQDVAPYAVMALGKLKATEARTAVERFVDHPEAWVRKEAKKALARLA